MSPQRSPREAGLTIEKRILAQSNDWALTIALSPLLAIKKCLSNWGASCCQHADVNNTNIDIYLVSSMPSTTLLTPINALLVSLKVLIQNERTRWFTDGTLHSAFVQGIVRVGYSPSLLLL